MLPVPRNQMPPDTDHYLRINEIKNYIYCARIPYYRLCLGLDLETGLSRAGVTAEAETKTRMKRRKHALHSVKEGQRHFDVQLYSTTHQIIGRLDEIVETAGGLYLIDYKDAIRDHGYQEVQMGAYQRCAQEMLSQPVLGQYVYDIGAQRYVPIEVTAQTDRQLQRIVQDLHELIRREVCPPPTAHTGKCNVCQYSRFCNDVR